MKNEREIGKREIRKTRRRMRERECDKNQEQKLKRKTERVE